MDKIIDKIIKIALYVLVFLLPIFFLPLTISSVDWSKQLLLAGICFLVSILWLIKIIKTGKINWVWTKISLAVLILLLMLGISAFFSIAKSQSFWGVSAEPDTLFNFILYGLTFFLFSNLISKKEVFGIIKTFLLSSGILALLFLIQEIFGSVFFWDFAKINSFNLIGSVQALAIFFGGAFVILIALMTMAKPALEKSMSILAIVIGILLFVSILLINFWATWLGIIFTVVIILWVKLKSLRRKKEIGLRDYLLPLVVLAIALMLILIKIPLSNILGLSSEVNLTYKASFDISKKTIGEGIKNLVFGSGQATFGYKYSLHRSSRPNLTEFWNIRIDQAPSALITLLATSGVLGILAILFLIGVFFYFGFKNISGNQLTSAKITTLVGGVYFLILWFFYSINFSLMFAGFLMLGLWIVSLDKRREISLVNPPQRAFFSMLGTIILMVILVFGFYLYVQKYSAALVFAKGLNLLNADAKGSDLDKAIININRAVNLAKTNDKYFRNLSRAFLFKINEILDNQSLPQETRQEALQRNMSNAQKVIQKAIEINPQNSLNWLQAGNVYEDLMFLTDTTEQLAVLAYKKAIELDPQNPQIRFSLGRTYKSIAQKIQQKFNSLPPTQKNDQNIVVQFQSLYSQALELAIDYFQESIELKYNFAPAYYLLGQVYEMKGEKDLAVKNYQTVLKLEPGNREMIERLEKLTK